jgi:hypothetical protein
VCSCHQTPSYDTISEGILLPDGVLSQFGLSASNFSLSRLTHCIVAGEGFVRPTGSLAFPHSSSVARPFQLLPFTESTPERPPAFVLSRADEADRCSFGRFGPS